jgi:hypothetical protein
MLASRVDAAVHLLLPWPALAGGRPRSRSANKQVLQKLHLYSIAAPGMRRRPESTQELTRVLGWADSITPKPGWVLVQKGYFDAPGVLTDKSAARRALPVSSKPRPASQMWQPLTSSSCIFVLKW